ncbi:MAG TPA: hypothetical protein PLZ08_11390 [Bacillota bacterium]|nr:hypothetical protein [Bacillota bacterium]HOL09295.1 hypothetical protein [Bacillota bacterium]HPO98542.1 hypothetical protein [Bacillota bacterium]
MKKINLITVTFFVFILTGFFHSYKQLMAVSNQQAVEEMETTDSFLDSLKNKYNYNNWAGKTIPYEGRLNSIFVPNEKWFNDYILVKSWYNTDKNLSFNHLTQVYQHVNDNNNEIWVDIKSFKDVMAAHEYLITYFSKCNAIQPFPEANIGDVGFTGYGEDENVIFCRLNFCVDINNRGETESSVMEIAKIIDEQIINNQQIIKSK